MREIYLKHYSLNYSLQKDHQVELMLFKKVSVQTFVKVGFIGRLFV